MSAKGDKKLVEPYGLEPVFERKVILFTCGSTKFYGSVGHAVSPELLQASPGAKLAVEAAHAIAKEFGHGPESVVIVLQRLRRWMGEGKLTLEQYREAQHLFDVAEDEGELSEQSVLEELVPILQRRAQSEVMVTVAKEYAARSDMGKVVDMIQAAARLGRTDINVGMKIGPESFRELEEQVEVERLPIGVQEIDSFFGGGVKIGQLVVYAGGTGDGKSLALTHLLCSAAKHGLFCGYATLEVEPKEVRARIKANLSNIPINAILSGGEALAECKRRLAQLSDRLGPIYVKDFTPKVTSNLDIYEWVAQTEQVEGRKMQCLVVDYEDKIGPMPGSEKKQKHEWVEENYENLRIWAKDSQRWAGTASQIKGAAAKEAKGKKAKRHDVEDASDSQGKSRVCDVWLNLMVNDEHTEMQIFVGKNRTGASRQNFGPWPVDYACAQIAPVTDLPF